MNSFLSEWNDVYALGEGTYAEVRLFVQRATGRHAAVKIVDERRFPKEDASRIKSDFNKEVHINQIMRNKHENVIKFLGHLDESPLHYIIMEYSNQGELFDLIEPDVGMPLSDVKYYFTQLLNAVKFLHEMGICHRDLKPENCLLLNHPLDSNPALPDKRFRPVLKLADFGLATMFRFNGIMRKVDRCCGTLPYCAPEVFDGKPYFAPAVDLWACGIIFLALCTGELPWDEARPTDKLYASFSKGDINYSPWTKLGNMSYAYATCMVSPSVKKRKSIDQLFEHAWMKADWSTILGESTPKHRLTDVDKENCRASTQPERVQMVVGSSAAPIHGNAAISQPSDGIFDHSTQSSAFTQFQNGLAIRLSQFFVYKRSLDEFIRHLSHLLVTLGIEVGPHALQCEGDYMLYTKDRRNADLTFKMTIPPRHLSESPFCLLSFRRSRGDGLEFKRKFKLIKQGCSEFVARIGEQIIGDQICGNADGGHAEPMDFE